MYVEPVKFKSAFVKLYLDNCALLLTFEISHLGVNHLNTHHLCKCLRFVFFSLFTMKNVFLFFSHTMDTSEKRNKHLMCVCVVLCKWIVTKNK